MRIKRASYISYINASMCHPRYNNLFGVTYIFFALSSTEAVLALKSRLHRSRLQLSGCSVS